LERSKERDQDGYTYAPVFSFTAEEGRAYTVISETYSSSPGFRVGESVRVRYDPSNPQNARIHSFFQTWGGAIIFGVVGVGFVGFGCNVLGLLHLAK